MFFFCRFHNIPNPNNSPPKKIQTIVQNFVGTPLQKTGWTKQNWPLPGTKNRKDLDRPKEHHSLWKNNDYPGPTSREIVDYSDIPANLNPSPPRDHLNKNNEKLNYIRKPIKMLFKKVEKKSKLLSPTSTITKPAFTETDRLGVLSPMTETSSSGGQSPLHPEELSLDKLEALKAKLYRELEESKSMDKGKGKENETAIEKAISKILKPPSDSSKTTEKKVKEPDNIFGSLLSSIDDQIISKTNLKKDKKESAKSGDNLKKESSTTKKDKDKEKDRRSSVDLNKKSSKPSEKKSVDSSKKEPTKPTSSSDFSKKDKKLMETVLKKVSNEDVSKKDKKLMETVLKNVEKSPKESPKTENSFEAFSNKLMQNVKDAIKLVNDNKKDDALAVKEVVEKDVVPIKLTESKPRITAADIMRDLEESIGISKIDDPLEKFGDLVKQKSSSLHRLNMNDEIIKKNLVMSEITLDYPVSGRLSDKYPHKRKISTDTRVSEPIDFDIGSYNEMLSPKSKIESQATKLSDPRLSDPRLSDPRLRINPIKNRLSSPEPNFPLDRPNTNHFCPPNHNHFPPVPPPDCHNNPPFQFTNMNNFAPGHLGNHQNPGNFFPGGVNAGRPIEPFISGIGNRTPIDPFLNSGNMTPVDPFLNSGGMTPVESFYDGPKLPPLMGQNFPPQNAPNFPNNFNNIDQRNSGNIWDRPPNNFEPNPQNIFQNNFNKSQNNPRFGNGGSQYELSQGNSLDFFENQENPQFNRPGGFTGGRGIVPPPRGGGSNFNNRGRGDHIPHNKFIPDNRRNKTDRGVNRDVSRDVRKDDNKRSSKYNDPRLSKDKDKEEYRNRRKSVDERSSSFKSSKSVVEGSKKPEATSVSNKTEVESVPEHKKAENNYSPLDSLYSGVTKTIGKGYGLQNFKIPKIKKPEVVEIKKDIKKEEEKKVPVISKKEEHVATLEKPVIEPVEPPVVEEAPVKQVAETKKEPEKEVIIEQIVLKREVCSPDEKLEEIVVANTNKEETETNAGKYLLICLIFLCPIPSTYFFLFQMKN